MSSIGYCFFCLSQIVQHQPGPNFSSSPPQIQFKSMPYLFRYLNMDLKKMFIAKGQNSPGPDFLKKVEKVKLKVELCEGCLLLSEKFSDVYQQLERLEMELESTLRLINGRIVEADANGKLPGSNWNGVLEVPRKKEEVLDMLRTKVIQKSSNKLAAGPRVKIRSLSKKEVKLKQVIHGNNLRSDEISSPLAMATRPECGFETIPVKMESMDTETFSLSDNDNGNSSDVHSRPDRVADAEPGRDEIESDINVDEDIETEDMMADNNVVSRGTAAGPLIEKCSFNLETMKWKCSACDKEYNSSNAFQNHYRSAHLKLRYQCGSCNKLFTRKGDLARHQRTTQSCSATATVSAPKFICHLCEKSFGFKHVLQDHLDGVHLKILKHECNLCEEKFKTRVLLCQHRRKVHSDIK